MTINLRKIDPMFQLFFFISKASVNLCWVVTKASIELSDRFELLNTSLFYIKKWSIPCFQCLNEKALGNTSFQWIPGIDWSFFDVEMDGVRKFNTYPTYILKKYIYFLCLLSSWSYLNPLTPRRTLVSPFTEISIPF